MRHVVERHNHVTVVRIQEDLGSQNTKPFSDLCEHVAEVGYERVLLDFTGVRFVSSMSITSLFAIYKKLRTGGGEVALVGVGTELARIFDLVGLPNLVRIFPSEGEALESLEEMSA